MMSRSGKVWAVSGSLEALGYSVDQSVLCLWGPCSFAAENRTGEFAALCDEEVTRIEVLCDREFRAIAEPRQPEGGDPCLHRPPLRRRAADHGVMAAVGVLLTGTAPANARQARGSARTPRRRR
jgi:hypothetical protein